MGYIFVGILILPLIWFIVKLVDFLKSPKDSDARKHHRIGVIISAAVTVFLWGGAAFMIWTLAQAVANM